MLSGKIVTLFRSFHSVLFVIAYTILFLQTTICFDRLEDNNVIVFFLIFLFVVIITPVRLLLEEYASGLSSEKKSHFSFCIKICVFLFALYHLFLFRVFAIPLFFIFSVTCDYWEENDLLKTSLFIGTTFIVVFFFLSMLGIVENNRGNSFGFVYNTNYAAHILCLVLILSMLKDGWFSWLGELALVLLTCLETYFVGGKTAAICLSLLILGTFWRHYVKNGGVPFQSKIEYGCMVPVIFKILYCPIVILSIVFKSGKEKVISLMKFSFPLCVLVIVILTVSYRPLFYYWAHVPGLQTFKSRLMQGTFGFEEFAVKLFGNKVAFSGNAGHELNLDFHYFIDSFYIKLLLEYGIILFIFFIGLMTFVQFRLYKHRRFYAMGLLSIYAITGIMEYMMFDLSYNVFGILSCCSLSPKNSMEACDKFNLESLTSAKVRGIVVGTTVCLICISLWSISAYKITTWRGWTPLYGATVVIPGNYIDFYNSKDIEEGRLAGGREYLRTHADAVCIVADTNAKTWLSRNGVTENRIYINATQSLEEMLTNANEVIKEKHLPNRLTVCTYDMQQRRVQRHATNLKIPVNSLALKMAPGIQYLRCFGAEQWGLLWKK